MFACALPLIVAICALRVASREAFDVASMNELLVGEIVQPRIRLLPAASQTPALPRSTTSETDDAASANG